MSMLLSERGAGVLLSMLALSLISYLVEDLVIAYTAASIAILMVVDAIYLVIVVNRSTCSCGAEIYRRAWIWDRPSIDIIINCKRARRLADLPKWLRVDGMVSEGDSLSVRLRAEFRGHGIYEVTGLSVERSSLFGLFKLKTRVGVRIRFKVYPETLYWFLAALSVLRAEGLSGAGRAVGGDLEHTPKIRVQSGVYYETREYMPGDLLKRLDWKATARRQRLMVKDYALDLSGRSMLIIDYRCPGRSTCDAIASSALSIAIAAHRQGTALDRVYDVQSGSAMVFSNTKTLLAYLLTKVFEEHIVDHLDLYEFIEPLTEREVRRYLSLLLRSGDYARLDTGASRIIAMASDVGRIIIISSLLYDVEWLVDLADKFVRSGATVVLVSPQKPWADAKDLEDAYRIYISFNLAVEKLKKLGVDVILWSSGRRAPYMAIEPIA